MLIIRTQLKRASLSKEGECLATTRRNLPFICIWQDLSDAQAQVALTSYASASDHSVNNPALMSKLTKLATADYQDAIVFINLASKRGANPAKENQIISCHQ